MSIRTRALPHHFFGTWEPEDISNLEDTLRILFEDLKAVGAATGSGTTPSLLSPTFPPGTEGEEGEAGARGVQGVQGVQGAPGLVGPPGAEGEPGDDPRPGPQGGTGAQGVQGILGPPGVDGEDGFDAFKVIAAPLNPGVQTTTLTGTQNDFALLGGVSVLRLNNASLISLTGLGAGIDGQRLDLISVGAGQVDLLDQNAGSVAANRLVNGVTGPRSLAPGTGKASLIYDTVTARWRVVSHDQGAWLGITFSGTNFTASTGTWTVDAGDVKTFLYYLNGTEFTLQFSLELTSVSATPNQLRITIPLGFVNKNYSLVTSALIDDNAAASVGGYVFIQAGSTLLNISKFGLTNYATAVNTTDVYGTSKFEVQ